MILLLSNENAYNKMLIMINGIKDRKIDINNSEDQIVVDTRDWRPGIYIISLIVNEKIIESVKFVIMH